MEVIGIALYRDMCGRRPW